MTGPTTTTNNAKSKGSGAPAPEPLTPGGCGFGEEGGSMGFRLTARTCLELLPKLTELQLDREVKYLQQLDPALNMIDFDLKLFTNRKLVHSITCPQHILCRYTLRPHAKAQALLLRILGIGWRHP